MFFTCGFAKYSGEALMFIGEIISAELEVYSDMCIRFFIKFAVLNLTIATTGVFAEGGISIQGTRIIYNQNVKQHSVSVKNSSSKDSFLVESWVENAAGQKTQDFIVTPPLFLSEPKNENVIRLMYAGPTLPKDKETLYYFINKEIPPVNEIDDAGKSVLRIAAASKIKIFVRPSGLNVAVNEAPSQLVFKKQGNILDIYNPSPYFITLTDINFGDVRLEDIMVAPLSHGYDKTPSVNPGYLSFSTINDYGAVTQKRRVKII